MSPASNLNRRTSRSSRRRQQRTRATTAESFEQRLLLSAAGHETRLLASDGSAHDRLGDAGGLDIDGDTIIVGSELNDARGTNSGAAYIFVRDDKGTADPSDDTWTEQQKLGVGGGDERFGDSVAIQGDVAVVAATRTDDEVGTAYVFVRTGTTWTHQDTLRAIDGQARDRYGTQLDIDGDRIIVGSGFHTTRNTGAAWVYVRDDKGTADPTDDSWEHEDKLTAPDAADHDRLGRSVAIFGDTAFAGAPGETGDQGAVYVFGRTGSSWSQTHKLVADDGIAGDGFGETFVDFDGNTLVVNANGVDTNQGAVYVFERDDRGTADPTDDIFTQSAKLQAPDGAAFDSFGNGVSIDGDTIVIGALYDDNTGTDSGSAYVYRRSGTGWTVYAHVTPSDASPGNRFGVDAGLSGSTMVVSADEHDANGTNAGAIYVYDVNSLVSTLLVDDGDDQYAAAPDAEVRSGGFQDDQRLHRAGAGNVVATWSMRGLVPGQRYRVLTTWEPNRALAYNAPFTFGAGTSHETTTLVNQKIAPNDVELDGVPWENLGVFTADTSTLEVTLSNDSLGLIVSDAVRLVEVDDPIDPVALVDDGDTGYTDGAAWWSYPGGFDGDNRLTHGGDGSSTARWTMTGLTPGRHYRVLATWVPSPQAAWNAPYTVSPGCTPGTTVRIDQKRLPDGLDLDGISWQSLGVFTTDTGSISVTLSNDAHGSVVADAVRVIEVPGTIDRSFGTDGKVTTDFSSGTDEGNGVAIQPDGKIVVVGTATSGGDHDFALARYNTNGTLDTTFDSDGRTTTGFGVPVQGRSLARLPNGMLVLAGVTNIPGPSSAPDFAMARYNEDGSLDEFFATAGKATTDFDGLLDDARAIAVQDDGAIVLAGRSERNGTGLDFGLARYFSELLP